MCVLCCVVWCPVRQDTPRCLLNLHCNNKFQLRAAAANILANPPPGQQHEVHEVSCRRQHAGRHGTALARISRPLPRHPADHLHNSNQRIHTRTRSPAAVSKCWSALRPGSPRPERPRAPAHGNVRDPSKQHRGMEAAVAAAARAAQAAAAAAARWAHVSAGAG